MSWQLSTLYILPSTCCTYLLCNCKLRLFASSSSAQLAVQYRTLRIDTYQHQFDRADRIVIGCLNWNTSVSLFLSLLATIVVASCNISFKINKCISLLSDNINVVFKVLSTCAAGKLITVNTNCPKQQLFVCSQKKVCRLKASFVCVLFRQKV